MATIAIYANEVIQMPGLIKDIKQSIADYNSDLFSLRSNALTINKSICDLDDVISSIQSSTQIQEEKIESLNTFSRDIEQFMEHVTRIDSDVADIVKECKDEFYEQYYYLKPECEREKNGWENFCDGFMKLGEWCKEHWKAIATVVLVGVAIAIIVCTAGAALGPAMALLVMVAKGIIVGATIGGLAGGTISALTGGSFFEGFENGAFSGAISGAITGGMGSWLSSGGNVALSLGKIMLIGATAETGASLLGDLGDIVIKGEELSFAEVMFNACFSFVLGGAFAAGGYGLWKILPQVRIQGINKGNGSWAHVWATQSARSLRHGTPIKLKTMLKGIGSQIVDEAWDYCLEPFKSAIDKWKESWNLIPQQ